jgi:hypothetical protein
VLYVYTYFWLHPMRIKLYKMLDHTCLEIRLPNKSMPSLGTFVVYWLHLSLSSCYIGVWAFSEKSIYFIGVTFSVLFLLHLYTTKTQKHFYLLFPVKLANQYPSSSWVWQSFLYWKVLQLISSTWKSSGGKKVWGEKCKLNWEVVCRPTKLEGHGVLNLDNLSYYLCTYWPCFEWIF